MVSTVLASLGLLGVILVALHWALGAALQARRRVPAPLATLYALLDNWTELFNPDRRADWRRRQRVKRAQLQREAIARAFDFDKYNRYGTFGSSDSLFNNTEFAAQGEPSPAVLALLEPYRAELPAQVFGPPFKVPRYSASPNALRANASTRTKTADAADAILAKMKAYQ